MKDMSYEEVKKEHEDYSHICTVLDEADPKSKWAFIRRDKFAEQLKKMEETNKSEG